MVILFTETVSGGVLPTWLAGKTMLVLCFMVHTAEVRGQVQAGSTLKPQALGCGRGMFIVPQIPLLFSRFSVQFRFSAQGVKTSRAHWLET